MGDIPAERHRITDFQPDHLTTDLDDDSALLNMDQLGGARRVSFAAVGLTGSQRPVPQLDHIRGCGPGNQDALATAVPAPQHRPLTAASDLHRRPVRRFDQRRQTDPQGIRQPQQCSHTRVHLTLLHTDDHAPAHGGCSRQLVESPPPSRTLLFDPRADGGGQGCRVVVHAVHYNAL